MKQVIHNTSDAKSAHALYIRALKVDQQNTFFSYMMATQELQATAETPAEQTKENPDDKVPLFKTVHNNPKEAAAMLRMSQNW